MLIGAAMQAAAWVVHPISSPLIRGREFYDVTVAGLTICAVIGVLATAVLAGRSRRWTALLVALSPGLILGSFINWDMIAMALTALAMVAWAVRHPDHGRRAVRAGHRDQVLPDRLARRPVPAVPAGGPIAGLPGDGGFAAVAWLVVNVPIAVLNFTGWGRFYGLNSTRGADWGSIWYHVMPVTQPPAGVCRWPARQMRHGTCSVQIEGPSGWAAARNAAMPSPQACACAHCSRWTWHMSPLPLRGRSQPATGRAHRKTGCRAGTRITSPRNSESNAGPPVSAVSSSSRSCPGLAPGAVLSR